VLHLFPPSSLDNSILTSVLVGVMVVWFFQETLGWNFTGLVVPGYLGSILVLQPTTGLVILAEAVVTWMVFSAISDRIPRWWPWSPLFGRDRFFGILLVSVAVRIALEGGGFTWMQDTFGLAVGRDLHSMSLVVVPLAANALWRTGFTASLTQIGVPVVLTWAILELLLLRATNLSLSSFELTYEDLALDFVSSPRAYILLLTGAWLGSTANLRWGWDYGGIIVPGLLSVCWLEPHRLAATLGEAAAIALIVRFLLNLPMLKTANLTGGRPLILAFFVGYTLKFVLGWTFAGLWPGLHVRSLFGFGYLLPTMIALRVLRAGDDPFRPIVPAVVTSLAGFVVGSGIGYALAVVLPAPAVTPAPLSTPDRPELAMSLLAWGDREPVPWVRPEGRPLAVTARVGAPGMPAALVAIARVTDARVVLLCGETGAACEAVRAEVARDLPLLVVEAGETTTLRVAGRLPDVVHTADLAVAAGPIPVASGPGGPVLVLAPDARIRAAAFASGRDVSPLDADALSAPLVPADGLGDDALRVFAQEVVGPWADWWRREPWADDALRLAVGVAADLGLEITATGDRSALVGPGFRVVVDRRGTAGIVDVTQEAPGERTPGVARAIGAALGAAAVVEDAPPSLVPRGRGGVDRAAHAALVGLLEALGSDARVTTVRALRAGRDVGADLVFSGGAPQLDPTDVPPELVALAHAVGVPWSTFDGSFARAWCQDPGNDARRVARVAAGDDAQVTVYVGPETRDRLGAAAGGGPTALLLGSGALDVETVDLWARVATAEVSRPDASWDRVREAAGQLTATGSQRDLRALQRLAGGPVTAVRDPVLGTRWLSVRRCDAEDCDELLTPLVGACPSCVPPADPSTALALGAGDLVLQGPAR
jgi:hypothetical protein